MRTNSAAAQIQLESSSTSRAHGLATVIDAMARQARDSLRLQAAAVAAVGDRLDARFAEAVRMLHHTKGHVIVTGLGKSGHVGRKIAATFASTGTPSFFVHSTEALHGDLGMITPDDTVLLISYSGETAELLQLLPHLRARGVSTVALVGITGSGLANGVDVALDVSVDRELCPHNLAPTCSTLAALAMGDTLAVSLMRMRSFDQEDFARLHPGGGLGRRLTRAIDAAVRDGLVILSPEVPLSECVLALASSDLGLALVRDEERLVGVITPVELQRALTRVEGAMHAPLREIMNRTIPSCDAETFVGEAETRMEREGHAALVVLDDRGDVAGLLLRPRRR